MAAKEVSEKEKQRSTDGDIGLPAALLGWDEEGLLRREISFQVQLRT